MSYELDPAYKQVPERLADFKAKHPEGSLQPADPFNPYRVETIGDRSFIVYVAAAYRTPDDRRPGIGIAWEPFPGTTPYTRNSELQNAETSAWGRAIVAALASEAKAVASAEDVRNRRGEAEGPPTAAPASPARVEQKVAQAAQRVASASTPAPSADKPSTPAQRKMILGIGKSGFKWDDSRLLDEVSTILGTPIADLDSLDRQQASKVIDELRKREKDGPQYAPGEEPY